MINLLSPDDKQDIKAARLNVLLLRYTIFLGASVVGLLLIFGAGFWLTEQSRISAIELKQQKEAETVKYAAVKKEGEDFTKNLQAAKSILANETIFSRLIVDITNAIPSGVILNSLNLTTESLGAPLTLNAQTKDYDAALRLKSELEASDVFENVSITSATTPESNDTSRYPVTVTLSATLTKPTVTATLGGTTQ